jgi:hypothetical protein
LLVVRVTRIIDRAHEMTQNVIHFGIQQSFTVARSHYENIDLEAMGQVFTLGYKDAELDEIKKKAVAPVQILADQIEGEVIPKGVN